MSTFSKSPKCKVYLFVHAHKKYIQVPLKTLEFLVNIAKYCILKLLLLPCSRVNVLGSDPRMNPFNNDYFNGRCDRVRNPGSGQYDRLPWNVGVLNYEVSHNYVSFVN